MIELSERVRALEEMTGSQQGTVISALAERVNAVEQKIEEVLDTAATAGSVKVLKQECEELSKELKALKLRTQLAKPGKGLRKHGRGYDASGGT